MSGSRFCRRREHLLAAGSSCNSAMLAVSSVLVCVQYLDHRYVKHIITIMCYDNCMPCRSEVLRLSDDCALWGLFLKMADETDGCTLACVEADKFNAFWIACVQ